MNIVAKYPRTLAVLFSILMVGPIAPQAAAQDHVTKVLPDLPTLGQARPTDTCLQLGDVQVALLAAVAGLQDEGTGYFAYDRGVPAVCGINGQRLEQWKDLVMIANGVLDTYRTQAKLIQDQADSRLEYTYPDGPCQPGDELMTQRPETALACGVTRPQFVIIDDHFDGRRVGGFGSWSAVTEHGEAPGFQLVTRQTFNGTDSSYRFGDDSGYARGAHEFLVSPELDLTAVRGLYYLVNALTEDYALAQGTLNSICHGGEGTLPVSPRVVLGPVCAAGGDELIKEYKHAIDSYTQDLPITHEAVGLDLTFRSNFAPEQDGIRPWIYVGDHQPTRTELFDRSTFGRGTMDEGCQPTTLDSYTGRQQAIRDWQCFNRPGVGYHLLSQEQGPSKRGDMTPSFAPYMDHLRAFKDPDRVFVADPGNLSYSDAGFTGDILRPVTVHLDLTSYVGERVWIVLEVATTPDTGRGQDPFHDPNTFARQDAYGFDLVHMRSQGDAWPRNLRMKDVAQTYQRVPAHDLWRDAPMTRTTNPPGADPIVVRIQNAGEYYENATVKLVIQEQTFLGGKAVGSFHEFATVDGLNLVNVKPSEVRELHVPWPKALVEGDLYKINASISPSKSSTVPTVTLANVTNATDPNDTAVRPQNAADLGLNGATSAIGLVRAFTNHHLTAVHAPAFTTGPVIEVCKSITIKGCVSQYTADKGERRIVHAGVRNDGSTIEDVNAVLTFTLDGIDRPAAIVDAPTQVLRDVQPGETRAVDWAIAPADAGVYDAIVTFMPQNATDGGASISRLVYVQRSTGIICFDNVGDDRECAPSFERSVPEVLAGADLTSVLAAGDGTLYATSAITNTTGALFTRLPGREWVQLENLSNDALALRFGMTPRWDLGFANVTTISLAMDGTLYMAGDNGTALARSATGNLTMVPWAQDAAGPLAAFVGNDPARSGYSGQAGRDIPLAGGASGGSGEYSYGWSLVSGPPGGSGVFADPTSAHTTFLSVIEGAYVLNLNVTDSAGHTMDRHAMVTITMRTGECAKQPGIVLLGDAYPLPGNNGAAANVQCVRASDSSEAVSGSTVGDPTKTITVYLDLAGRGVGSGKALTYQVTMGGATASPITYGDGSEPSSGWTDGMPSTLSVTFTRQSLGASALRNDGTKFPITVKVSNETDQLDFLQGDARHGSGQYALGQDVASPAIVQLQEPASIRRTAHGVHIEWDASDVGPAGYYVVERANNVSSDAWAIINKTGETSLDDLDLDTYHTYGYRVTPVDEAGNHASDTSAPKTGIPLAPSPKFLASAIWNGTLWLSSTDGAVWHLNETSAQLEKETLPSYNGDVHAILATDDGLYAAGEFASIFLNEGNTWGLVTSPKDPARAILALTQHDGKVFASGEDGLVERSSTKDEFLAVASPNCYIATCDYAFAFETPTDQLYIVTKNGNFTTCAACLMKDPVWSYPIVPVPTFLRGTATMRAQVTGIASNSESTVAVTTGGSVLEYAKRSMYDNEGDWSVASPLTPHDDGIIETRGTRDGGATYRWNVTPHTGNGPDPATDWTELRVTLHHAIWIPPAKVGSNKAEVRVYYAAYPQAQTTLPKAGPTCQTTKAPSGYGGQVAGTCNNPLIMRYADFVHSSASDGWDENVLYFPGPTVNTTDGTQEPVPARFDSIEFYADKEANWVIDDFVVESRSAAHDWLPVVYYKGNVDGGKLGHRYYPCGFGYDSGLPDVASNECNLTAPSIDWIDSIQYPDLKPFDFDPSGKWHVTAALTDRPVWVLNDEEDNGINARLQSGWNTRLISPIIDLGEAYDPVITFRQAYAFRTKIPPPPDNTIEPWDAGWVEVQYERQGAECGSDKDVTATCWSPFKKVFPDRNGAAEYPRPIDIGFVGTTSTIKPTNQTDVYGNTVAINTSAMKNSDYTPARAVSSSYWGRSAQMLPDETGTIPGGRDTSGYDLAVIRLSDPQNTIFDQYGNAVSMAGRHIRVAFHAYTAHVANSDYSPPGSVTAADCSVSTCTTFPREGWYITDLKVKGARQLGIDLAAANMTFRVGYDTQRIGVGPGTRVSVNVTIENRGLFDVLGYTAQFEVRRVTDVVNGRTEGSTRLALGQQPLLPMGTSRNHTFYWEAPSEEDAKYVISFVVTPIGIPRDEDPTDNTAVLGSITNPIVAHTRPEYHVEFFVTPENATTDITRYAPIFINNTGNVLLSDFVVTRVVSIQGTAAANFAPETKTWTTQRAAPPGMRSNLQGLSDEFDPAKDLFWKASQRSDYKFFVGVTTPQLPPSSQEKLIRSFATYFFDDVDVGPRGEAMHGDWQFDDEWSTQDSGFRSDKAYGFGDSILMRYPDNADSSAITPVIDLSGARSARFGLYTRFLFPDSFDAGVVEASADAGKTWHRLTPRPYVDENGTSTPGYGVTIAASSPLHLTHDPAQVTNAFSGDSRLLPGNTDGWIYREFDLSDFTNISEAGLPYVKFDSAALANYRGTGQTDPLDDPTHHGALPNLPPPTNSYYDSTWSTGALDKYQYWESQNLTESTVASPVGHPTIWWSGSASITDDEKRPQHNTWLNISMTPVWYEVERNADGSIRKDADGYPIPLDTQGRRVYDYGASGHITSIDAAGNAVPHSDNGVPRAPATKFEADDHVIADWWEWFDRYGLYLGPNSGQLTADNRGSSIDLASAWQYAGDGPATNIRVNVTKPTVIEAQGKWLHMQSDITDYRPGIQEHNVTDLSFVYAPLRADGTKSDGTSLDGSFGPYDDGRLQMNGKLSDDRGFAVDGFHIAAYKLVNGAPANERVLLSTEDAWNASTVEQCVFSTGADDASLYENTFGSNTPPSSDMPCWHHNPGTTMLQRGPTPSNRTLVGDVVRGIATKGSTTTLTDSSKNFTTLGAFVGDVLLTTGAVADGGSQNLVITGITNFTNLTNFTAQNGISCSQDTPCEINDTLTFAAATKINVGPGHEVTYEIPMGVLGRSDHVSPAEVVDDRADFSLSGVQPGDILIIVSGDGQGYQAPIVAVDHHVITLGAEHNGADSAIGPRSAYRIKPFVGNVGTSWAIVPQLPGLPSTWNVTDVRVSAPNGNYSKSLPLPTGETPKAWYTGNICSADTRFREAIDAKTPPTMADVSFVVAAGSDRTSIISTTRDFLALGVKAGDFVTFWSGTGAGNVTFVREVNRTTITVDRLAFTPGIGSTYSITSVQRTCLRAGSEERLVTPAIDLTRVAGDDATLTFWQRYAFFIESVGQDAFASGGVVEVQTFDPQTGWGAWQQIYACPAAIPLRDYFDAAGNLQGLLDPTNKTVAIDGEKACATHEGNATRGGYSAYTVNLTHSSNSEPPRLDPPFQAAHHVKRDGRTEDVQLLYSGNSASITHDPLNAWVPAHFDLTSFLGKQVRIGFHVAITGNERSSQLAGPSILDPVDVFPTTPAPGKPQEYDHGAGWWIANVSIVGTVLEGKPVQLRLRAVTDGNVHDGQWQFDDAGLFGSRYGRSIGVFVDQTPGAFGAFANNSTTIPLTLRNLGDTVRRDLAIEARQITSEMGNLALSGVEGQAWYLDTTDPAHPILRISGFNLAPGQSVTIPLTVGVPKSLPKDTVTDTLHIVLKEYSAPDDKYVDVPDNEVVGFLQRDVDVTGQRGVQPKFGTLSTTPAGPAVGELVNVTMDVTNPGYGPITLDLSCTATLVGSWTKLDRRKTPEPQIETSTDHQCTRAAGKSVLSSHETSSYVFQATPTAQGIMTFKINGTVSFGAGVSKVPARSLSAAIGRSSVIYHDGFMPAPKLPTAGANDPPKDGDVKYNWTHGDKPDAPGGGGGEPTFDWPRGHDEPGAMLLGIPDRMMEGGASYNMQCGGGEAGAGTCTATSPPIDLHNYTSEHLALSFWYLSKFAKGDGARVTASILVDETKADQAGVGSWISECVIQPVGGYKGYLTEYYKASSTGGDAVTDYNGYPGATGVNGNIGPNIEGFYSGQSDAWQYAVFDLFGQGCKRPDGVFESLLGHTIRINFVVFAGAPAGAMMRGNGQGWFIDDITLSPQSIDIAPPSQSAVLLDNTTKAFNVILTNTGSAPDIVRLRLDEGNSSVPRGSISVPADVTLAPKETRVVQVQVTLPRDPSLLPTLFKARILAQSLIDPAARGTSDLIIEFGPRPWAELTVHADAPGGIVQEGTESFIPITVENDGVVDSVASSVNVVDHYVTSNGIAHDDLMTLDLPSMPSYFEKAEDASRVIEFRWRPARGSVGTHTLTITADPQQLGEEYTRLNNVVVLNVNVSELLIPDLDVTTPGALKIRDASNAPVTAQKDADVTRYEVTAGELATLELKLVNHGKAGATNVDLRAFIGTLSLPPKSIPYVPPGAELTVTFNWLAQKGEYPIEVIVRTEQVEGSTTNNRNPAKGVTLLIVKGYEIKTTIADVPMDIVPPMDVKVPFNVTNSGNAGEDLVLTASAPDGWSVTLPWTSIFLSAGKTTGAIATVHVPEAAVAGEQFITIQATARENPMKVAGASTPLHVHAFYGGSIGGGSVQAAPPGITIPIELSNEGNSLEPWSVTIDLPRGWTSRETLPAKVVVPPHGSTIFNVHAIAPETTAPGDQQMLVKATLPNGEKREGFMTVGVTLLRVASVTITDDQPKETLGALAYPVTVENTGNVNAPFKVLLLGVPEGITARLDPDEFPLAPGERALATLTLTPSTSTEAGAYQITGYSLFEGVHPDTDEGKANVQSLRVTIVRPDLRMGALEYAPHTGVSAGDRVTVKVPITNRGQGTVTDLPVHLFVDDIFVSEARIPALRTGERRDATLNWTALPGQHTLTAVVDPWNDTVDAQREDNAVSTLVDIESGSSNVLTGAAKVPMPGATWILLIAAAAAILLARRERRPPR